MKRIQWIGIVMVLGLMLAVVLVLVRPAAPTAPKVASPEQPVSTIEKPVALDDAMLTLTVSDFHGFLDGTGSVASQVSPMMSGAMIGTMLGAQLGDPQLAGIPAGKGFAVVMMSPTNIFAMVEVDEAALAAYTNAVAKKGLLSVYRDGVLVLGTTPSIVEQGADRVSAVRGVLLAKRSPTLRIALQPARLIAEYKTGIDGLLGSFSEKLEQSMQTAQGGAPEVPQGTFKILEAELRVLLSLAEQVQTTEVTLAPANGSLQIVEVDQAVPGSRLAALCAAPVVNRWSPKVPSGVCASGAFQLEACIPNSRALSVFINGEMEHLMDVMDLTGTPVKGWLDYMNRSLALYGGTVSESIFGGETGSLSLDCVLDVTDEAAALNLLRTLDADMKATGMLSFYEQLGMPMSIGFQENVREHSGVAIHQLNVKMDTMQMTAEQRAQFEAMHLNDFRYDLAVFDGVMGCSIGGAGIDALIDRVKAQTVGAPLVARSVYPAGAFYYGDFDVGRYMSFVASFVPESPENPLPQISTMLQGAVPITSAGFMDGGMVQWEVSVPGSLLARIGQAAMTLQMQNMQKQQKAAPQPIPQVVPQAEFVPQP